MRRREEVARLKETAERMIKEGHTNKVIRDRTGLDWKTLKQLRDTYKKTEAENEKYM
jgi:hypothetical protein